MLPVVVSLDCLVMTPITVTSGAHILPHSILGRGDAASDNRAGHHGRALIVLLLAGAPLRATAGGAAPSSPV